METSYSVYLVTSQFEGVDFGAQGRGIYWYYGVHVPELHGDTPGYLLWRLPTCVEEGVPWKQKCVLRKEVPVPDKDFGGRGGDEHL